jgi:hypothetical protein
MTTRATAKEIETEIERLEHLNAETLADEMGLWGWGKWARSDGSSLGYPRCLLPFVAKGWGEKDLGRVITDIPEEQALRIDQAVSGLPVQHRTVIVAIYQAWTPIRSLPLKMNIPRSRMEQYHNQAVGMIWAALKTP